MQYRSNKTALSCILFLLLVLTGCSLYKSEITASPYLFTKQGYPQPALSQLLQKCNIQHDNSLASIVEQTQKQWLRPTGVERFNMSDAYADRKQELKPLFKDLGLVDDKIPTKKHYRYCLVHGASLLNIRARIACVVKLWLNGIRFDQLVFLTGARDLDPIKEDIKTLTDRTQTLLPIRVDWQLDEKNLPKTETDMVKLVYEQAILPAELRKVPMVIIDAPKQVAQDGSLRRPNTENTIKTWLDKTPDPGLCLAISNQPYVGYQDSVTRTILPAEFELETVGLSMPESQESVALWLDSLARWLYQEQIRMKKA